MPNKNAVSQKARLDAAYARITMDERADPSKNWPRQASMSVRDFKETMHDLEETEREMDGKNKMMSSNAMNRSDSKGERERTEAMA